MIDITIFCEQGTDPREWMRKPFRDGQWVYATNGHVCVRVPAGSYPDAAEKPEKFGAARLFVQYIDEGQGEFVLLPDGIKRPDRCRECRGRGHFKTYKCPDCDEGEFDHGNHTYSCLNCADEPTGPGWMLQPQPDQEAVRRPCSTCRGHGMLHDAGPSVEIGGMKFDPVYLWWMSQLPQVRVRINEDPKGAAAFIFDGGQALVMPRNH